MIILFTTMNHLPSLLLHLLLLLITLVARLSTKLCEAGHQKIHDRMCHLIANSNHILYHMVVLIRDLHNVYLLGWCVHVIVAGGINSEPWGMVYQRMPFVRHIYNASKQISSAISPDQNTQAFKEVAIIRHPRIGEYAFGFITSSLVLQNYSGEEELFCVYVPTNHLYLGDIFLVNCKDVIRPNLSVREGIEIVVSGGMSMPQILSTLETQSIPDRSRPGRN
ncbi:hypothetical protein MKW92_013810 [Papaver armeniacum]|nr:hypothetical protein MKW92_013810 [Papaver armeniacum]